MSLLRRLKKLRKMSGGEIGTRISDVARRWQDRCTWRVRNVARRPAHCGDVAERLADNARKLVPGAARSELTALEAAAPGLRQALAAQARERASRIIRGECDLFGFSADIRGTVDWHRDPRSEHRWPRAFYATLDLYELPGGIDVKYVWELNRHQFLVELSRAWLFTGEESFAARARELILDWIDANPLYEGVNWTSALEAAVRGISWLWTLAGLADWPGWQPEDSRRIAASLVDHARYLEHHFSLYSSPYNHLIGEAAGLFILGAWLDGFPAARGWREKARQVLFEHGPRQFYADGFCVEQATGYHFFTLGFLAHALTTSQRIGESLEELRPAITHAFSAGSAFMPPDGRWPAIGDVDSARAFPVLPDHFWDFRSIYGLGAVLCRQPEFAQVSDGPGAELYWLEGTAGIRLFAELTERGDAAARKDGTANAAGSGGDGAPKCRLDVLPDSGYSIVRAGDGPAADWLLFDCGPIADGLFADATPSTAHGHADPLQVLLHLGGRPILTDPGMAFYFGPREWVDYFRGASAHNTVEIEGCPVARHAGRLAWSHACQPQPMLPRNEGNSIVVSGRVEPVPGNSITRSVRLIPGQGVWIVDRVTTDRPRQVRIHWQFPAGTRVVPSDPEAAAEFDGHDLWIAQWSSHGTGRLTLTSAAAHRPRGWQAPGYGVRLEASALSSQFEVQGELTAMTYFGADPRKAALAQIGQGLPGDPASSSLARIACRGTDPD